MIPRMEEETVARRPVLPWESIDPRESYGQTATLVREPVELPESLIDEPRFITGPATVILERRPSGEMAVIEDDLAVADLPEIIDEPEDDSEYSRDSFAGARPPATIIRDGGGWTIAVLCLGLSLIAACVIIPQADANRRLIYEREKLRLDLAQIQKQSAVNQEFLSKIQIDPQLAERLAQRQMKMIRTGTSVLDLQNPANASGENAHSGAAIASLDAERMSPFSILHVPPPPPLPAYQPVGGVLAGLCRQPQSQLYLLGAGMLMVASGLVLGDSSRSGVDG